MERKLRMGMVGGGNGAFVGALHRAAARMDGRIELVCGTFSSNRQRSYESGAALGLDADRVYANYREMFRREAKLPDDRRMDFLAIVTPNNMHYPIAMASLDAGYHVLCDRPMTLTLDEATNLDRKLKATGRLFCLTQTLTALPMVREARHLVHKGRLGKIRRVVAEYPRGWLATRLETNGNRQAVWRTDPKRAGATCCMSDLGIAAENLMEYVTGLRATEVCADLATFVKGRLLDDDASVLLRFGEETRGVLWASQVAVGAENGLSLRLYGEKGGLEWRLEEPDTLLVHGLQKPTEAHRAGAPYASPEAAACTRMPTGHAQGLVEAYATLYTSYANALYRTLQGEKPKPEDCDFPSAEDGIRSMKFLDAVVKSAKATEKWVAVEP